MFAIFWVLFFQHSLTCCSDEIDNGIASYFLQKSDMDQKLSVHIKATLNTDIPARKDGNLGLGAINKYQRLMIAKQGSLSRMRKEIDTSRIFHDQAYADPDLWEWLLRQQRIEDILKSK